MSDIPSDLYPQILLHLPAESLLRVRAVCKSWRLIIDDPSFIKSHTLKTHSSSPSTLLVKDHTSRRLYSIPNPSSRTDQTLIPTRITTLAGPSFPVLGDLPTASCHGLILHFLSDFLNNESSGWVIWNPVTRLWRRLSSPAFDDSSILRGVGFGYDHTSDDYKVVMIRRMRGQLMYQTLVYSLKSGKWKEIKYFPLHLHLIYWPSTGVYSDGELYWLCDTAIVVLDLASEVYRQLSLPVQQTLHVKPRICLDVLDGCLFVMYYYNRRTHDGSTYISMIEYDVWMMEVGISEWISVLSSKEHGSVGANCSMRLRPVAYSKTKGEVVLQNDSHFYCFDVRRNSRKKKKVAIDGLPDYFTSQSFQGSLVRLGS